MKFYLLILLFFILPIYSQANIVFVTNSIQPIQKQFNLSYAKYVIKSNINLMSQNVVIPEGAVLCFVDSGRIENGTLIGNGTKVMAQQNVVFSDNILLKGSWKADTAYSIWFDFKSDCVVDSSGRFISGSDNSQQMNNILLFDNLLFNCGVYYFKHANFQLHSDMIIDGGNSVFKWNTSLKADCFMAIGDNRGKWAGTSNIQLKNFTIIGNKSESDIKTEQCHGICIRYGSNIILSNLQSGFNRGDGLYIGNVYLESNIDHSPSYISVINCIFSDNHRQGSSITRANHVDFLGCKFINTNGTPPQAGLDIEPNDINISAYENCYYACENIRINNCFFSNNAGNGLLVAGRSKNREGKYIVNNIFVNNSVFDRGNIRAFGLKNMQVKECDILTDSYGWLTYRYSTEDVLIDKCKIICCNKNNDFVRIKVESTSENKHNNIIISNCSITNFGKFGIFFNDKIDGISGRIVNNIFHKCGKNMKKNDLSKKIEYKENIYND